MFRCTSCSRDFSSKQSLQRHGARLVPCKPAGEGGKKYICKYCSREFNHASNRCSHQHICKEKPAQEATPAQDATPPQDENVHDETMKDLIKLVKDLKLSEQEAMRRIANDPKPMIQVNNFGSECTDRITDDVLKECLNDIYGVQKLIKFVHFNDDFPNDKNIRRGSVTNKTVKIVENGRWTLANKNTVLDKVIREKVMMIMAYNLRHCQELDLLKWYTKILYKTSEDYFNIRNELFLLASSMD
jgi:hypothetical protein